MKTWLRSTVDGIKPRASDMHIRTQWRSKGGALGSGGTLLIKIKF